MTRLERWLIVAVIVLACMNGTRAQNPTLSPYQISVPASISASLCVPIAGTSTLCLPGDGNLYLSANGGAFAKVGGSAGVTSLSVNGGTPQSGAVALTIPSTALIPAQSAPLK